MAGTTAGGLPYPTNTDPVNIAVDIQALADAVDAALAGAGLSSFLLMGA